MIRLENENDYLNVEEMVRNSFWNIYRPGAFEHYIVHNLRNDKSFIRELAYVIMLPYWVQYQSMRIIKIRVWVQN